MTQDKKEELVAHFKSIFPEAELQLYEDYEKSLEEDPLQKDKDMFFKTTTLLHEFCNHTADMLAKGEDASERIRTISAILFKLSATPLSRKRVPMFARIMERGQK